MIRTTALIFAAALLLLPLATPPAQAAHVGFSFGAGFQIGNAFFSLAFGAHDRYAPGYYYRTTQRLDYPGHRCSDRCFRDGRTYYHAASCPVVAAHLNRYRVAPGFLFDRYAPTPVWGGRYYRDTAPWRYDRYDRYDRYGRHDHRDRYDRHDRYDRRDRYDRYEHRGRHDRYDHEGWRDRRHDHRDDRDPRRGRSGRSHGHRHHSPGHGSHP